MGGKSRGRRWVVAGLALIAAGVQIAAAPPVPELVAEFAHSTANVDAPRGLADGAGNLYFRGRDSAGLELWRSNGTPAGTVRVRDINPGSADSTPFEFTVVGSMVYFSAIGVNATGAATGRELWRTDGTAGGTSLVADIRPGGTGSSPNELVNVDGVLYFAADDGTHGEELWRHDPASAVTELVRDINPAGTAALSRLTKVGSTLFFRANDGVHGSELWKSDAAGTDLVQDFNVGSGSSNPVPQGGAAGRLFFVQSASTISDLWTTDGTPGGTAPVIDAAGQGYVNVVDTEIFNGRLYCQRSGGSTSALWATDGTASGTVLVKSLPTAYTFGDLTVVGDRLFFTRVDNSAGLQVWMSDGTTGGTVLVKSGFGLVSSGIVLGEFTAVGETLFFRTTQGDGAGTTTFTLWISDGTENGTLPVAQVAGGTGTHLTELTDVDGTLFYSTGVRNAGPGFTGTLWRIGAGRPSTPPVVTIQSPAPGTVVGTATVDVTADVTHAAATTVVSVPVGVAASLPAGGGTATGTVPLASDGPNTITVSASDAFNNVGGTSVEVIRDTTAPLVTVTSPAAGAVVGMGPVDVTIDVADLTATTLDVGGAQQSLAAGGGSATFALTLAAGANDVAITATDAAGNATMLTHRIVLDLDAPVVSIDAPTDGQRFGPGASPIAVVARVDDLSATTVASSPVGVADSLPPGGGIALGAVDLVEGNNTITVTATDATSRVGSASVTVVFDTTAPAVSFAAPQDGDAVRGTIDLHVGADDALPGSGVTSVAVTLDGNPLVTLTSAPFETTLDTTALADGPHLLAVTATDGVGNTSTAVSISILVDNTPPVIAILAPADGSYAGGTAPFEATVADAASGVAEATMTVGGLAPTTDASRTYATPVASDQLHGAEDTTRWPDGLIAFAVTVRDAAGNVATASATVGLDNSNPASSLVAPHDGDVVSGTISIEAAASDPHLASLTVLVDGVEVATSATSPLVATFDTTTRLDGPMTVELRVADSIGNTSTSTAHVSVDNVTIELKPALLHLKTNGGGGGAPADATLTGSNLALLLPTESHAIELRIPGGNSVPAVQGWDGDDALSGPGLTRLKVRFSRAALVASIRAGIAGGHIDAASRQVLVTLVADGRVQGTTVLGFVEGK